MAWLQTCLYCDDIPAAHAFYERVFGLTAMIVEDRIVALDAGPNHVLILFKRGGTPGPGAGRRQLHPASRRRRPAAFRLRHRA